MATQIMTQIVETVPAGMNVVVASARMMPKWYKTKKSFMVDAEKAQGICPIRNRSFIVQRVEGMQVWFSKNQIVRSEIHTEVEYEEPETEVETPIVAPAPVVTVEPEVEIDETVLASFTPVILCYDIPASYAPYSPVGYLRSRGFHLQGSVWVVDANNMPWEVINEMLDMPGVDVMHARFHGEDARKLVARAVKTLQADIAHEKVSAERKMADANTAMTAAAQTTGMSQEQILTAQLKRSKAIQKRLNVLETDLTKACGVFGINPRSLNVAGLGAVSRAIKTDMETQARTFRQAYRSLVAQGTAQGTALAATLLNGSLPPVIAADALDDHEAGSGEALRTAFADNGEFNLTDMLDD